VKAPRFSPDQLIFILALGLVVMALAVWRSFTLY
jgi:hypothetical protein